MRKIIFLALFCSAANVCAAQSEIKLGATLPLSGDIASYGYLIRDGIELAAEDLRAEGVKVSVAYEDVPLPTADALSAIKKLIDIEHINGVAGNFWNPVMAITGPELTRKHVVAFHTAAPDDLILGAGDFIFSTNAKIKDEAAHLAEYAFNTLGARTANVLYIETNFGDNYQRYFVKRFEELGGKVLVLDSSKLGDNDLKPALTKVRQKPADVFFAAYFGTNLGLVLKQAREVGLKVQTLGVYESEDPSVIETAGAAAEGLKFFVAEAAQDSAAFKAFRAKFVARYKYEPRVLGSNAYDATKILAHTLLDCKLNADCTKDKIYQLKNYEGASGSISIDPDGGAQKRFVLKTVANGKFVRVNDAR